MFLFYFSYRQQQHFICYNCNFRYLLMCSNLRLLRFFIFTVVNWNAVITSFLLNGCFIWSYKSFWFVHFTRLRWRLRVIYEVVEFFSIRWWWVFRRVWNSIVFETLGYTGFSFSQILLNSLNFIEFCRISLELPCHTFDLEAK